VNRDDVTGRRRCHVAVRKGIFEYRVGSWELAVKVIDQALT